jgi:hypothetical protein
MTGMRKTKTFNETMIQPVNNSLSNHNHSIRLMLAHHLQKLSEMLPRPFMSIAENHVFHVSTRRRRGIVLKMPVKRVSREPAHLVIC